MLTDRTLHRGLRTLANVAAVQALPDDLLITSEYRVLLDVFEEQIVSRIVLFLNLADSIKEAGNLVKAFLTCHTGKLGVHARPFLIFSGGGSSKILLCVADAAHKFEPDLRMCLLVNRRLIENVCDLDIAVFLRLRCLKEILRMRLRFTGKCGPEIFLGL